VLRGKLHGDPTLPIERAKNRGVHREVFSAYQRLAVFAANPDQPDITALRPLLTFGVRKGDAETQREGADRPDPDRAFWVELDIYMRQAGSSGSDYLLCRQNTHAVKFDPPAWENGTVKRKVDADAKNPNCRGNLSRDSDLRPGGAAALSADR
jgi:hypothetical protein